MSTSLCSVNVDNRTFLGLNLQQPVKQKQLFTIIHEPTCSIEIVWCQSFIATLESSSVWLSSRTFKNVCDIYEEFK